MSRKITTEIYITEVLQKNPHYSLIFDYSDTVYTNSSTKIQINCIQHGLFDTWPKDHRKGLLGCKQCSVEKRKQTNIKKYGVENIFQRTDIIESAMLQKHGVKNPGLMCDHVDKIKKTNLLIFGTEYATQNEDVKLRTKLTNIEKYGFPYVTQNKEICKKMIDTKIRCGSFTKSNSSIEATTFIQTYIKNKNYKLSQCAFADFNAGLFEWGMYHNGKWVLYDLVVFEENFRGNKDHIIEIVEYHGPFHYTEEDLLLRGNDNATPWKSCKLTIKESIQLDNEKQNLALSLTSLFTVIWSGKYHNKNLDNIIKNMI